MHIPAIIDCPPIIGDPEGPIPTDVVDTKFPVEAYLWTLCVMNARHCQSTIFPVTLMQMKELNEYENTYQSYLTACASDGPHPPHSLLPSLAS